MTNAWDTAMRGLSDLELQLIMQGSKNGTLKAVGAPENSFGAGLKAAMELNRRDAIAAGSRRAKTPKAVECEASQSGAESASPNIHRSSACRKVA